MSTLTATLILVCGLGQAQPPGSPPAGAAPERIAVAAVYALNSGSGQKDFAAAVKPFEKLLETLPYDTFTLEAQHETDAPYGQETRVRLNDTYTLVIVPVGKEQNGDVRFRARVEMGAVNALLTDGQLPPGRPLVFRGLDMPEGELVVIMTIQPPNNQGQQGAQSGDDQQQQQDQEQQQEPSDSSEEQQNEREQEQQAQEDQEEQEAESQEAAESSEGEKAQEEASLQEQEPAEQSENAQPKDLENIDAILKSLEDLDKREQKSVNERRRKIGIEKDWW